jgi:hypothetical protein
MIVPTNTVRFIKDDEDEQLMMTMRTGVTWSELSEKYLHFLKGCGYQVTAADLAEYYTTLSGD